MKVSHPDIADCSYDVPAADVDAWIEQGWIAEKAPKKDPLDK